MQDRSDPSRGPSGVPETVEPRFAAVVLAAGRSLRFGEGPPKQYLDLGGITVLERSVAAVGSHPSVGRVIVVVPPGAGGGGPVGTLRSAPGVDAIVEGGATRSRSCRNGLRAVGDARFVLVHDAARPLVRHEVVDRVVRATLEHGAAVPVVAVADTVKTVGPNGFVGTTLDRTGLRAAQTPQGARTDWLEEALDRAFADGVEITDEASALERAGHPVRAVEGDAANRKITTPADLEEARARLAPGSEAAVRVGTGYDVHRFGGDRPLVLGGVVFPGEPGLEGHSDADVVLHAAMDAVLGAAGLPDIGAFYPPGDPRFEGADSAGLAAEVRDRVAGEGWAVVNLDLTVLAQRPRIRHKVQEMRGRVAACFGIDPGRVGLKATTLEGLGALGRAEGIACQAAVLLERRGRVR